MDNITATDKPPPADQDGRDRNATPSLANPFFAPGSSSWTDALPKTEHVDLFRRTDFGSTSLGPTSDWGPAMRLYVTMLFADSRAACLYWGPEHIAIYNEPQSELVGKVHPRLMGQTFEDAFPTIADTIKPLFARVFATAQTTDVHDILLFPIRYGILEETYFIGQFIPVRGDSGLVEGVYNTVYESTFQVLYDRRRRVLDDIASIPPDAVDGTLVQLVEVLRSNPNDITMAILYSLDELEVSGNDNLRLRGSIGVPENAKCAPFTANLEKSKSGLVPFFRQAKEIGAPILLSHSDGSLQNTGDLFDDISWGGYGEASRDIVIAPLTSGEKFLGFYVQGANPRRPYDQASERSIMDLTTQIAAKWVSSMSMEEAAKREELLQRRLTDRERRMRIMAQVAPVGMCQIGADRTIQWANDEYYRVTGHERTGLAPDDIFSVLAPEHRARAMQDLEDLLHGKPRVITELALTRKWSPPGIQDRDADFAAWILVVCFPMVEDGNNLVMVYVTDISHQKWAESVQSRHAATAVLAKKQQEDFIDMTSHEMRNPLTAMMQLADGISRCLDDDPEGSTEAYKAIIEDNIEAANTILTCTAHQKRIIDDVLILSRLESNMLSITPVPERPSAVVENTVKMFDGEIAMANMQFEIKKDASYDNLNVHYALFDTTRLSQVLINLISNAIKFTVKRPMRKISVTYGAEAQRPRSIHTDVGDLHWLGRDQDTDRKAVLPALQDGEVPLYLYFCIQDTGVGVKSAEMDNLFKRFSQASKKTHTVYGGSGLGLYICRELVARQSGQIGAASRHGEGSVFGFYIETRHTKRPQIVSHAPAGESRGFAAEPFDKPSLARRTSAPNKAPKATSEPGEASVNGHLPLPLTKAKKASYHVLLVEDNTVNQKIFAKCLGRAGLVVTIANHGEEALDILEKNAHWRRERQDGNNPIEIVVMDWEMPVMNGLQCCERIRALEHEHAVPVPLRIIGITAYVRQEQITQAVGAGMDNVLPKPFTASDLLERIWQTMGTVSPQA